MQSIRSRWLRAICTVVLLAAILPPSRGESGAFARRGCANPTGTSGTCSMAGDVANAGQWDVGRVERDLKSDVQLIHYTFKGTSHDAHCIPLLSLVMAARPAVNPHIKHHTLQFIVQVQGFDGYTVDFSLAELMPEFGNRRVWVAMDEDGAPLKGEGGAFDLLAVDDVKPARWVHGVTAITVLDGVKLGAPH
jgi:hypothetical protein